MDFEIYPETPILSRAAVVLASSSPRRRELISRIIPSGKFEIIGADIDESLKSGETPGDYVQRLAVEKAQAGAIKWAERHQGSNFDVETIIIGADTTVVLGQKVLGKPETNIEAFQMLQALSGERHTVITGLAVLQILNNQPRHLESTTVTTVVEFKTLSKKEIDWYITTREPMDKAGAYAIQGYGGNLITSINGDYYNVVGLPLVPLITLLKKF